jgi:hypothetical protein
VTDSKKPEDSADNPEQVKLDSSVGTSVPEPAAGAPEDPEKPEPEKPKKPEEPKKPEPKKPKKPKKPAADTSAPQSASGTDETAPHDIAVPVAVARVNVSVVEVPMEISRTKPLELPARSPGKPTEPPSVATGEPKPDDAKTTPGESKPDDANAKSGES